MNRKGIILAGGNGTRLHPLTRSVSKQLLPVYDKPMIFYPLCTLLQAGITEIAVIVKPEDVAAFRKTLGDGSEYGCQLTYLVQLKPSGIAEALVIAGRAGFLNQEPVALILGDNIFHGGNLLPTIKAIEASLPADKAAIFGCRVASPERYGVIEFSETGTVKSVHEKPRKPPSSFAVPGLYFYPSDVVEAAGRLRPSQRGELEITDLNNHYIQLDRMQMMLLQGVQWFDAGTFESLHEASQYMRSHRGERAGDPRTQIAAANF